MFLTPYSRTTGIGFMVAALATLIGCRGTIDDGPSNVTVTVQGQYEKRLLSASGFTAPPNILPTRYAFAQVINSASNQVEASGTLDASGSRTFSLPRGITFHVAIYATTEVPNTTGTGFYFYGQTKKATASNSYANTNAFNQIGTWATTSADVSSSNGGNLTLRATETTGEAGAFAISDQMTSFALGMRGLEPTLQLPELYAFWNPGSATTYPSAARTPGGAVLVQSQAMGGRAIFQHSVRYAGAAAADRGADAYNDSLLWDAFTHLLVADDSLAKGNGTFGTIVRRDNDHGFITFTDASEPSIAFTNGFCTFLAAALRYDPYVYDIPSNGGLPAVFRLDQHTGSAPAGGGEFYAGSVARSLWGIWTNGSIFNTTQAGLKTMWSATIPTVATFGYEYGNTPLACYPTYLTGLTRLAGSPAFVPIQNELYLENVGNGLDPTSNFYLNSTALWLLPSIPFTDSGSFPTYSAGWSFDWNQYQAYRFTHGGGPRTLTLSTSGAGLVLDLFDSQGLLRQTTASSAANGVINLSSLVAGTYVVRVRVDPYVVYANGTITYNLAVN